MATKNPDMRDSTFSLELPEHFSFAQCLGYLNRSSDECLYQTADEKVYKLLKLEGKPSILEISGGDGLQVCFADRVPDAESRESAFRYIREWFDLETDLAPFYRLARENALLAPVAIRFKGLRLIGVPDLFEALSWAILGQQITLRFAYTLKKRVVETFGEAVEHDGRVLHAFPEPQRIAALDPQELQTLQLSRTKAAALIEVARLIDEGSLSKQRLLRSGDFRSAFQELVSIRGIGPWTAHYVLMRCLRDRSAFPVDDVGLQNAVKQQLAMERKPTPVELRRLFDGMQGWEAYASFYLWKSIY